MKRAYEQRRTDIPRKVYFFLEGYMFNAGSLGDTGSGMELGGGDIIVAAEGHPAPEVGRHPAYGVVP